jgi:protein gp37
MTDLFLAEHPDEWIAAIFGVMALAAQHTFQVLTKRVERAAQFLETWTAERCIQQAWKVLEAARLSGGRQGTLGGCQAWPLQNVWLLASVGNQQLAERRLPGCCARPRRFAV